jgi:hypothetical protein
MPRQAIYSLRPTVKPTDSVATPSHPTARTRLMFAVGLGLVCAVYVFAHGRANPDFVSDFDQVWAGARALWLGQDPYHVVGPRGSFLWKWPLYYPLPALLVVAPLGLLPVLAARIIFSGVTASLLGWAATRDGWQRLPIFISVSFMVTVELVQWSSLYTAMFFLPALAWVGVAKPNFGAAVAASSRSSRTLVYLLFGSIALVALSEMIRPGWHESWFTNVRSAPHFRAPVTRPFGFLLLLAALKWRRPEARWLLALSLVPAPQTFYDQLMLAVVCMTARESLIFAASTVMLFFYVGFYTPQPDYLAWGRIVGNGTVWFCFFPALAMVLRRPNEGPLPAIVGWFLRRKVVPPSGPS